MCQRSSAPTPIREVIQLSLWPTRRLAGQAAATSPAVQLDARARPSGGGRPRVPGCSRAFAGSQFMGGGGGQPSPTCSSYPSLPPLSSLSPSLPPSLLRWTLRPRNIFRRSTWNSFWQTLRHIRALIKHGSKSQTAAKSAHLLTCSLAHLLYSKCFRDRQRGVRWSNRIQRGPTGRACWAARLL